MINKFQKIKIRSKGALLFELLIVISLLSIILSVGANAIYLSMRSNQSSGERDVASSLASESLEAMRAITEENWQNIYNPANANAKGTENHYHPEVQSGKWVLVSGDDVVTMNGVEYTRYVTIENVSRASDTRDIENTYSLASDDPSAQKVTVTVGLSGGTPVSLYEYFFRWKNKTSEPSITTSDTDTGIDTAVAGSYSLKPIGPPSADMTGIALSGNPSGYTFASGTYSYTGVTVSNSVASVTVTPTGAGVITVDGVTVSSGQASGAITLTAGVEKTITITTTESLKSSKTYTISITRNGVYALTIPTSTGTGTGTYGGTTAGSIEQGTSVSITATPSTGSGFTSWTATGAASACNGSTSSPCAFTMTGVASVTAVYTLNTYTVTGSSGAGGTISPASRSVSHGATTTFTVTPNSGYLASASGCSGSLSGTTYTTGVITANCTVTASFALITIPLVSIGNITGTPQVGQTLTAGALNPVGATVTYQWRYCATSGGAYADIGGATSSTYVIAETYFNKFIKVVATGVDPYTGAVTSAATAQVSYSIGYSALGGKIAYILVNGDPGYDANVYHGLVATTSDKSTTAPWGCSGTAIAGADGTAIGTGNQNTVDILTWCGTAGIAARLASDLSEGGYSDWFLPSKDELNKLYINRVAIGNFDTSVYGIYWSSSEYVGAFVDKYNAWFQRFSNASQEPYDKAVTICVRPIRSF
jgi:Tfp pilus assembly protein FimT